MTVTDEVFIKEEILYVLKRNVVIVYILETLFTFSKSF